MQETGDALRQGRIAGCVVAQGVGVRRKAVIVIQHGRLQTAADGEGGRLPVRRHHHDGARALRQHARDGAQEVAHRVPHPGWIPIHEEARPRTVRNEEAWHAPGVMTGGGCDRVGHGVLAVVAKANTVKYRTRLRRCHPGVEGVASVQAYHRAAAVPYCAR